MGDRWGKKCKEYIEITSDYFYGWVLTPSLYCNRELSRPYSSFIFDKLPFSAAFRNSLPLTGISDRKKFIGVLLTLGNKGFN